MSSAGHGSSRRSRPATRPTRSLQAQLSPSRCARSSATSGRPEFDAFRRAAEAGREGRDGHRLPGRPARHELSELELWPSTASRPTRRCVAATSSAAELMGLQDELGTVEAGKRADLVVVDGDPFAFDTLDERVEHV